MRDDYADEVQADHVRNGTAKNIMDLQVSETTALWEGIKTREFLSPGLVVMGC